MLTSEKIAIAAHLHVLLRRKTGRVTDVEWMAANREYAAEVVRFAREHAVQDNAPELAEWSDKLEFAMQQPEPPARRPVFAPPPPVAAPAGWGAAPAPAAPAAVPQDPATAGARYVGRLR